MVAIGGVAFAVGRSTAPASATTLRPGGFVVNGPNASFMPGASGAPQFIGGRGGLGGAGLTIRGTVESVDGDTVTIKTANGQTIEVTTDADTTYTTQTPAYRERRHRRRDRPGPARAGQRRGRRHPTGRKRRPDRAARHGRQHHRRPVIEGVR